jgi:hypothetical protein
MVMSPPAARALPLAVLLVVVCSCLERELTGLFEGGGLARLGLLQRRVYGDVARCLQGGGVVCNDAGAGDGDVFTAGDGHSFTAVARFGGDGLAGFAFVGGGLQVNEVYRHAKVYCFYIDSFKPMLDKRRRHFLVLKMALLGLVCNGVGLVVGLV